MNYGGTDRRLNIYRSEEIIKLCHGLPVIPSIKVGQSVLDLGLRPSPGYETKIEINNLCTIAAVLAAYPSYEKILVLNMANATHVGGGWLSGAEAQEEYLFRRTDLHLTLSPNLYPMKTREIIYSPVVQIIYDKDYNLVKPEHYVSVASVAAACRPPLKFGKLPGHIMMDTSIKIEMLFRLAIMNRHDCLILSALGCGAFRNPPMDIAEIFMDMCEQYAGYFKCIIFAIKCVNDDTNLSTFQNALLARFANPRQKGMNGEDGDDLVDDDLEHDDLEHDDLEHDDLVDENGENSLVDNDIVDDDLVDDDGGLVDEYGENGLVDEENEFIEDPDWDRQ
jgi:uncharacterized protein (TIGR02452 family)